MRRVAGDDVAGAGRGAADCVARRPIDVDAVAVFVVAQGEGAALVGTDEITLDDVVRRVVDLHAVAVVRGDYVASGGGCPADRVARGAGTQEHAFTVAHGVLPGRVGADVIPLDEVGRRIDCDARGLAVIARDHVASGGGGPTDRVVGGPSLDKDAGTAVVGHGARPVRWCR